MNPQAINNRLLAGLVTALLTPFLDRLGIKLTQPESEALVVLAPVAWHAVAGFFTRYFPPPNPTGAKP